MKKKANHCSGVFARLNILKALLTSRTDMLMEAIYGYLNKMGHVYPNVIADLEPISFMNKIKALNSDIRKGCPNFSELSKFNYYQDDLGIGNDWISEQEVSEFVGKLTYYSKAVNVIEVGCFIGITSSYIAKALAESRPTGKVFCIDIEQRYIDITTKNLIALGLDEYFVTLLLDSVNEDAINALPNNADIIFIDSSHAYENTCKEIQLYSQKLSPGGCLVLHDSIKWPGVREAIVNVRESYYILTFATSRGNGLTVMFQKKTP